MRIIQHIKRPNAVQYWLNRQSGMEAAFDTNPLWARLEKACGLLLT